MGWMVLGIVVVALLVFCGGGGFAAYWLVGGAVEQARGAAARVQAINNAKQISLALMNYQFQHKYFPASATTDPTGKPLLSWRVTLLPFIGYESLYNQFHHDEPWDSSHNRGLIGQMPPIYGSPPVQSSAGMTNWLAVIGPGSVIASHNNLNGDGSLMPGMSPAKIIDGLTNTIIIVEADRAVIWTKPDDYQYDQANPALGLGSLRQGQFLAAFADASVRTIPISVDAENMRRAFSANDGQPLQLP